MSDFQEGAEIEERKQRRQSSQIGRAGLALFQVLLLLLAEFFPCRAQGAEPLRIGATVSLRGKYKEPSGMIKRAFQLWAKEIRQEGGLLGRDPQLILRDDESSPELCKEHYERFVQEDEVDLLFSPYGTPLTMVASEVSEEHGYVMLAVAAAAACPWQRDYRFLFQLYAPAKRQFIGLLDLMARENLRTLALIHDSKSPFNVDMIKGVKHWAKHFQIEVLLDESYEDGEEELPAIVERAKELNAHGLINSSYSPNAYRLLRLLDERGYRPTVLAMPIAPAHPSFKEKAQGMSELVFCPSQWEPIDEVPFPGTQGFIENFEEFAACQPSFHATSAYAACQIFERAIKTTKSFDNERLRDFVASLDTVTVLGRYKVDPSGMQVGHNSFLIQWQGGKKEIVWPRKMQTAPVSFYPRGSAER